jgi:hypothetical protein
MRELDDLMPLLHCVRQANEAVADEKWARAFDLMVDALKAFHKIPTDSPVLGHYWRWLDDT